MSVFKLVSDAPWRVPADLRRHYTAGNFPVFYKLIVQNMISKGCVDCAN